MREGMEWSSQFSVNRTGRKKAQGGPFGRVSEWPTLVSRVSGGRPKRNEKWIVQSQFRVVNRQVECVAADSAESTAGVRYLARGSAPEFFAEAAGSCTPEGDIYTILQTVYKVHAQHVTIRKPRNNMKTSQYDEQVVINDLIARFKIPQTCVEFGAYDGITNSNTYELWHDRGYRAVLIEPDPNLYEKLCGIANQNCTTLNSFVTREKGLTAILQDLNFEDEIGVLSIDIDANDIEIFEAIDHTRTHIVVVEYNQQLPVWCDYRDPPGASTRFRHSARALMKSALEVGYGVVASTGPNLVFLNGRHHQLSAAQLDPDLDQIFDYAAQDKSLKDPRVVGCKFTTNAKVFTQQPSAWLRLKAVWYRGKLAFSYRLRGKHVPPSDLSEDHVEALRQAGLFV